MDINLENGRSFLSKLKNKIIFADLKLHDIPNTCLSAVKAIKDLKLDYLTIHVSSGLDALKAVKKIAGRTKIVGVTILTSMENKSLREIGFTKNVKRLVYDQAKLAKKANLDAIVWVHKRLELLKKYLKKK